MKKKQRLKDIYSKNIKNHKEREKNAISNKEARKGFRFNE